MNNYGECSRVVSSFINYKRIVRIESLLVIRLPEIMLLISIIAAGALRTEALKYLDFTSVTELFIDFLRFFDGELKIANM